MSGTTIEQKVQTPYFSTFQIIVMALLAVLIVVAKIALRLPVSISGHSGLFWMAILVVGAGIVPKRGAATIIGMISAIVASFLGLGDKGGLDTFLSYTLIGVGTDLALMLLGSPENLLAAALVGILGHLSKFLVVWAYGVVTGVPLGFMALGLALAVGSYILWGALGGLLGALTLRALRRAGFFAYLAEKR